MAVSAENVSFGANSLVKYRVNGTLLNQLDELSMMEELKFGQHIQFSAETLIFGQNSRFQPKMSLTAVITVSVKFHLFRFKIYGFGVSPKNIFRSHTTYKLTDCHQWYFSIRMSIKGFQEVSY